MYTSELEFEKDLVTALTQHGWDKKVLKNVTEQELIDNWANILFMNNKGIDRLNGVPLSDGEKAQLLEQINSKRSPYELNKFINGKTISIKRDNPQDPSHLGKEISLFIYDRDQIAGGKSTYQIVEQPIYKAKTSILPDRRGDVTLLINGMPVIHIELKRSGIPVSQAAYQIQNYKHEGVFTGFFSLVQVFVAMTPEKTLYFANPGDGKVNDKFEFEWADVNNEPYKEWSKIVEHLLSIPMAHKLIGFYTVPDATDGVLKVMRSYQYYAVEAINNRVDNAEWTSKDKKGGYIFHTTGSGKTMTSFKAAQLIASSKKVDKVVFLMDRIELGTQSWIAYNNFASSNEEVQKTENTNVLITKLKSDAILDTLIVTSIQKMSNIKIDQGVNINDINKINSKKIVFVIDECHRSTFGLMLATIKNTFPKALYFGFTGTPIYEENEKKDSTTTDVFGNELHRYSIADGIRDGNVLGFDPIMVTTFKDNELKDKVALEQAKALSIAEAMSDPFKKNIYLKFKAMPMASKYDKDGNLETKGIEDYVNSSQYRIHNNQSIELSHPYMVVKDILSGWETYSLARMFSGIFATSSIAEAAEYYRLFKKMMGKDGLPIIKIATMFDPSIENDETGVMKSDALLEMLTDYNKMYDQKFNVSTYQKYKTDVCWRLAHKESYKGIEKTNPEMKIDLLIVVDQMLTGYDSKWINILYLDKKLESEMIVQAFSRTNRIFGPEKPHGIIKWYRYPHTMHNNVYNAFKLYSGNKPYGYFVDKLEENLTKMNHRYEEIKILFKNNGIENFERNPDSKEAKAKFAKLFNEFNKLLDSAKIQEFYWDKLTYEFDGRLLEVLINEKTYMILVLRYKELFKKKNDDPDDDFDEEIPYDIDPHITEINTERIDADYLNSRFEKFIIALQENGKDSEIVAEVLKELHTEFATLTSEEQKYADMIIHDIQYGEIKIESGKAFRDYLNIKMRDTKTMQIHRFAEAFGMDEKMLKEIMSLNLTKNTLNEFGRLDKLLNTRDNTKCAEYFEKLDGARLLPFRVSQRIREYTTQFILEEGFDIKEF